MATAKAAAADAEHLEHADHVVTPEAPAAPVQNPDRVAMVSYRADGTPDQTPGFQLLAEP